MEKREVVYEDQSASGLCLNIIEGDLDMAQFNLLVRNKISGPDFTLEAAVIGASHVITYIGADIRFHEVFACTDVITDSKRLFCGPLERTKGHQELIFGQNVLYDFRVEMHTWDEGESLSANVEERAVKFRGRDHLGLVYAFPAGADGITPKTIVVAQALPEYIDLVTVHSYPNEGNIVITKTMIKEV